MSTFFLILFVLLVGIWVGLVLGFSQDLRGAARRIHGTKPPVFAKLIVGIGCVALVAALATALYTWHFTLTAQRTSGTVIEMREQTDKDSAIISFAPTFRFQMRVAQSTSLLPVAFPPLTNFT